MPALDSITIVSGLPRSGTSMAMQMLDAGGVPTLIDQLRRPDADNVEGYFEFDPVKRTRQDPSWVADAPGKAVKVIYMLLYDLPPTYAYRVIFMHRRLDEVIASQAKMLARLGKTGATAPKEQLQQIFENQLKKVEAWLANRPGFSVLNVKHRDVIENAKPEAERINEFLGGGLDVEAMSAVVKPTLHRQRSDT